MRTQPQVLIVGAGPSGLVLALLLARFGIPFRIIDKEKETGTTSRALIVHARTLEFYRQLGIADDVVQAAQKFVAVNLWVNAKPRARLAFGDIGATLSKYPYSLIFPQDKHEQILIQALGKHGVEVERDCDLVGLETSREHITGSIRRADGNTEQCEVAYIAGCDGAHSTVRETVKIGLPGGTYSHLWYVVDVDYAGPLTANEVYISMDRRDALAVFPMREAGRARVVGQAPPKPDGSPVAWGDVSVRVSKELRTQVHDVRWFSTYHVHHRVAEHFRKERVFLVGDAAHLHSPVGGQGMNTGIGDAVNLAWKLAAVLRGQSSGELLDSYEPERIRFARGLVASTDRMFSVLNSKSPWAGLFRTFVAPTFLPPLLRLGSARALAFRILSQTSIEYRNSPISLGRVGCLRAGDRLPFAQFPSMPGGDNFAPLNTIDWQVHFYGEPSGSLRKTCEAYGLPLHAFMWQRRLHSTGLRENALYLVRPDGHVGFAHPTDDTAALERYLLGSPAFITRVQHWKEPADASPSFDGGR